MECLPKDPILKYNSDTLKSVRKEFNIDDEKRLNEAIDLLDDWVKKQTHFLKTDYPREYLERTLVTTKGSIERAKSRLDKLCTLKSLLPNYFSIYDIKQLKYITEFMTAGHLYQLTNDNYRVYILKLHSTDVDFSHILDYYRSTIILSEYIRSRDYIKGMVTIFDYRDVNIVNLVTKLNPIDMKNVMTLLMEGYGMRLKAIHILSASKMIDTLISLMKQVISTKVASRIHVHKDLDTLYDHVPKEILPKDYGGAEKPLADINRDWIDVVGSEESVEYTKAIFKAGTNEDHRQSILLTEQYSNMPGSFRSLTVD